MRSDLGWRRIETLTLKITESMEADRDKEGKHLTYDRSFKSHTVHDVKNHHNLISPPAANKCAV